MQRLEASVAECLALMKDIALLVQWQGEQLTSIEENVKQAKEYVIEGNQNLQEAKEEHQCFQKSSSH
jgi:t-SNARE complex subunit (syntaxin)